jgi:hypothetical protein
MQYLTKSLHFSPKAGMEKKKKKSLKGGEKRIEKLIFREYVEDVPFI